MRGMLTSGLVWPSKWVGRAVRVTRMHTQGLDGRPQKNLTFLTSESGSSKKWFAIAHENREMKGMPSSGIVWPSKWVGQAVMDNWCINRVLTDVHKKIWHFWRPNPDHPKNGLLEHTKIIEIGGYAHFKARFTFKWVELAMSANQILSQGLDVHPKIYLHFDVRIRKTPKMVCYIAH